MRRIFDAIPDRARARRLLRLVNWLMRLPDDLTLEFRKTVNQMIENSPIPEMMDFEIEWMEKGKAEGLVAAKQQDIVRFLRARFGALPERVVQTLASIADPNQLDSLVERAAIARSIAEFEEALAP